MNNANVLLTLSVFDIIGKKNRAIEHSAFMSIFGVLDSSMKYCKNAHFQTSLANQMSVIKR